MWGPIAVQGVTGTDVEDALDEQLDHLERGLAAHDKTLDDDSKAAVEGAIEVVGNVVIGATMGASDSTAYDIRILGHTNPGNSPSLGAHYDHLEIHIDAHPNVATVVQDTNPGPQPGLAPAPTGEQVSVPPASQVAADEGMLRNVTPPSSDQPVQVPVGVGQATSTDAGPTVGETAGDNVQRIIDPIDGTSTPDSQTSSALNPAPNTSSDALPADPNIPSATGAGPDANPGSAVLDPHVPELTSPTSAPSTDAQFGGPPVDTQTPDSTEGDDSAASQPPTQPSSDPEADTTATSDSGSASSDVPIVLIAEPGAGDELTGEQFSVAGEASEDGTVIVYDGDATLANVSASDGRFSASVDSLEGGSHSLWARLSTADGQVADSESVVVSVIPLTQPSQ